jgi:hypothetical protein
MPRVSKFEGEDLRGARYVDCQLDGAEFREVTMVGARFVGSVLIDVEIDSLVQNVTVNGVWTWFRSSRRSWTAGIRSGWRSGPPTWPVC